ncbi:MAG: outer membrane protein assembly factor BamE [Deltaproteobacteria bacterium]|nr:outer membrane protein assembly factor BamE [Deltaproteobacteria bacterium]
MGKKLAFVVSFLFLLGCLPAGRDFPTVPVKEIQTNVTTKNQIFSYFGEPVEQGLETGGYETWTYYYIVYSVGGVQTRKQLQVTFNKDNTVRSYSFTSK